MPSFLEFLALIYAIFAAILVLVVCPTFLGRWLDQNSRQDSESAPDRE